jgi:hypothetical protein
MNGLRASCPVSVGCGGKPGTWVKVVGVSALEMHSLAGWIKRKPIARKFSNDTLQ